MELWSERIVDDYVALDGGAGRSVFHSLLLDHIGDVAGKRILEFGCGEGSLAIALANQQGVDVVALDNNPHMIKAAECRKGGLPNPVQSKLCVALADETEVPLMGKFDLVVCSLVLNMIPELERVTSIIRNLLGSLSESGNLIIAVTHPCFRWAPHEGYHNNMPSGFQYWDSGTSYEVSIDDPRQRLSLVIRDFHWTLSDYYTAIKNARGCVCGGLEVGVMRKPSGGFSDSPAAIFLDVVPFRSVTPA
jgi:SAM-dependent methyltransferase